MQTLSAYLVLVGVHPAGRGSHSKFCDFLKNAGDTQLWAIISRDIVGRFRREYTCWKGYIVYFQEKIWKLEFTVFSRFWVEGNIRYVISFVGHLIKRRGYSGLNHPLRHFEKRPSKVCTLSRFSQKKNFFSFLSRVNFCNFTISIHFASFLTLVTRIMTLAGSLSYKK